MLSASVTPTAQGYYGPFGGMFIPEILKTTFEQLITAFKEAQRDPEFWESYVKFMQSYSCRPTPVTPLDNIAEMLGGHFRLLCKREDLNQTGAHKANNVMGQGLLVHRYTEELARHGVVAAQAELVVAEPRAEDLVTDRRPPRLRRLHSRRRRPPRARRPCRRTRPRVARAGRSRRARAALQPRL